MRKATLDGLIVAINELHLDPGDSLSELRLQVEQLRSEVQGLRSELLQRPVVKPALLVDLADDHLTLSVPLQVSIEEYEDEVTASWPEVEAFGSGDTETQALSALKRDIVSLHDDLNSSPDAELGALAREWKKALQRVIKANGALIFTS